MTPDASANAHPIPAKALEHESDSIYDRGLEFDVRTLVRRRAAPLPGRSRSGRPGRLLLGTPLTINLTVTDASAGYAALTGAAVYAWHCDAQGRYSMYSDGVTDQTFLRGVVETDAQGTATFTSVFPGCYSGRWPHIHFEVYAGEDGGALQLATVTGSAAQRYIAKLTDGV